MEEKPPWCLNILVPFLRLPQRQTNGHSFAFQCACENHSPFDLPRVILCFCSFLFCSHCCLVNFKMHWITHLDAFPHEWSSWKHHKFSLLLKLGQSSLQQLPILASDHCCHSLPFKQHCFVGDCGHCKNCWMVIVSMFLVPFQQVKITGQENDCSKTPPSMNPCCTFWNEQWKHCNGEKVTHCDEKSANIVEAGKFMWTLSFSMLFLCLHWQSLKLTGITFMLIKTTGHFSEWQSLWLLQCLAITVTATPSGNSDHFQQNETGIWRTMIGWSSECEWPLFDQTGCVLGGKSSVVTLQTMTKQSLCLFVTSPSLFNSAILKKILFQICSQFWEHSKLWTSFHHSAKDETLVAWILTIFNENKSPHHQCVSQGKRKIIVTNVFMVTFLVFNKKESNDFHDKFFQVLEFERFPIHAFMIWIAISPFAPFEFVMSIFNALKSVALWSSSSSKNWMWFVTFHLNWHNQKWSCNCWISVIVSSSPQPSMNWTLCSLWQNQCPGMLPFPRSKWLQAKSPSRQQHGQCFIGAFETSDLTLHGANQSREVLSHWISQLLWLHHHHCHHHHHHHHHHCTRNWENESLFVHILCGNWQEAPSSFCPMCQVGDDGSQIMVEDAAHAIVEGAVGKEMHLMVANVSVNQKGTMDWEGTQHTHEQNGKSGFDKTQHNPNNEWKFCVHAIPQDPPIIAQTDDQLHQFHVHVSKNFKHFLSQVHGGTCLHFWWIGFDGKCDVQNEKTAPGCNIVSLNHPLKKWNNMCGVGGLPLVHPRVEMPQSSPSHLKRTLTNVFTTLKKMTTSFATTVIHTACGGDNNTVPTETAPPTKKAMFVVWIQKKYKWVPMQKIRKNVRTK